MTRIIALTFALATLALAACNTVAGAGQDISNAGSAITHEADKVAQ